MKNIIEMVLLNGGSHIDFRTQCIIMTLTGGVAGLCQWRFENEKNYRLATPQIYVFLHPKCAVEVSVVIVIGK